MTRHESHFDAEQERHLHHLVQPYVDGELSEQENTAVAALIERSSEARASARQQLEVRSLLRTHGAPEAACPDAATSLRIRARLLAALDEVDAREEQCPEPRPRPNTERSQTPTASGAFDPGVQLSARDMRMARGARDGWGARGRALLRGATAMIPAAAAAVALFVLAAREMPTQFVPPSSDTRSADASAAGRGKVADEADAWTARPAPVEGGRLAPRGLPASVELVSRDPHPAGAVSAVELFDHDRGESVLARRVAVDALPGGSATPAGAAWQFRGQVYHLGRDRLGRVVVEFDDAGVRHSLHYVGGERQRAALVGFEERDPDPTRDEEARALVHLAAFVRESR